MSTGEIMEEKPTETLEDRLRAEGKTLRAVTNGDVVPFAKRKCKSCGGAGEIAILKRTTALRTPAGALIRTETRERFAQLCGCAMRRFTKARAGSLVTKGNGQLFEIVPVPAGETTAPEVSP